jgi:glycerate 2-kinase
MRVLIAPNAFKNSLQADEAARAIATGLEHSRLECSTECFPVGDGGDGTAELLNRKLGGRTVPLEVQDPLGRKVLSSFGWVEERRLAVIELADASGLRLLSRTELDPLRASTFGTGELIRKALDLSAQQILLGVGGSATVDGATGLLRALGVRFLDATGRELLSPPQSLVDLRALDLSGMDPRLADCELIVLCDVANPLLGPQGAAAVFGPQKGAAPGVIVILEDALQRFAAVVHRQTGRDVAHIPHGGAAGGVAAGLHGLLNAKLVNGIEHFLDATHFDAAVRQADLVITGEGSIDEQTLQGKAPYGVAKRAATRNIPVIALAGRVPLEPNESLQECFTALLSIGAGPESLEEAMGHTAQNLTRTAREVGNLLAQRRP